MDLKQKAKEFLRDNETPEWARSVGVDRDTEDCYFPHPTSGTRGDCSYYSVTDLRETLK